MAIGFLIMGYYLFYSLFKGPRAGKNPWGALTLEWTVSSPPPHYNFKEVPAITHGPYDYDKIIPQQD